MTYSSPRTLGAHDPPAAKADEQARLPTSFLVASTVLVASALWLLPIRSSLSADETGTFWVIKDGLSGINRSLRFGGVGPLFYSIEWLAYSLGGKSELVLRLPSFLAMSISTFLFYRLGRRLLDNESALIGSFIFVSLAGVSFAAADARPYGIALMFLVASTLSLVRYLDEGKAVDAVAYVLLASATLYVHYLFAVPFVSHIAYALHRQRSERRVRKIHLITLACSIALLLLPSLPHLLSVLRQRGILSVPRDVFFDEFLAAMVPPAIVVGLLVGLLLTVRRRPALSGPNPSPSSLYLLITWWVLSPAILYGISHLSSSNVFWPRYLLSSAPALPLLLAAGIRKLANADARRVLATALVVFSIWNTASRPGARWHTEEQWRDVASSINSFVTAPSMPVILGTKFIESAQPEWLNQPQRVSALLAPSAFYPMRGRILPSPYEITPQGKRYLDELVDRELGRSVRFLLVTDGPYTGIRGWLDGRLRPSGFTSYVLDRHGKLWVIAYERASALPQALLAGSSLTRA